ncbi:MAG: hypothetical protein AAGC86_15715 [Pseudomonadota bacterium]
MPRPAGLNAGAAGAVFALLTVIAGWAPAGAQDTGCARELRLTAASDGLVDLRVSAPCEPYMRVDIAYGPFVLTEETSHEGHVDLRLPRVAAVPEAVARISDAVLFAALPAASDPTPGYVALIWSGDADLILVPPADGGAAHQISLGFPFGDQARRAEILVLDPETPVPVFADIAIGGRPCANMPIRAALLSSAGDSRVPLTLPTPGCGPAEEVVRLALPTDSGS